MKNEHELGKRYSFVQLLSEQERVPLKLWVENGERLPRGASLSGHTSLRSSRDFYGGGCSLGERTWG